jgi:hypothetical protein
LRVAASRAAAVMLLQVQLLHLGLFDDIDVISLAVSSVYTVYALSFSFSQYMRDVMSMINSP